MYILASITWQKRREGDIPLHLAQDHPHQACVKSRQGERERERERVRKRKIERDKGERGEGKRKSKR